MKPGVDLRQLPGALGQLAARGHGGAAVRLIMEWGGTKRYIPSFPRAGCPLAAIVGMDAALVLAEIRGGRDYDVPSIGALEPSLKGEILRHEGSTRAAARDLGCTERYVRKVRGAAGVPRKPRGRQVDPRQIAMFGEVE